MKLVMAGGFALVLLTVVFLSPWNLYQMEGLAHCTECYSAATVSTWVLGNPNGHLTWRQKPDFQEEVVRRAERTLFDSTHRHTWEIDLHGFSRLGLLTPSVFITETDIRNEFAIKYNNDESFGSWIDLQTKNGTANPEEIRGILRQRSIRLDTEPTTTDDPVLLRAWHLVQAYERENLNGDVPNVA